MLNFFRGFLFFTKLALILGLGIFISHYPGRATLTWFGYRLDLSIGALIALVLFTMAALLLIVGLWRFAWRVPVLWAQKREMRRQHKGYSALLEGLTAIAAGEFSEARRLGKKAANLNPKQPLNALLCAQAAFMSGKHEDAHIQFTHLSKCKDTTFLGLRGLILEARNTNNWELMRQLLHEALGIRPNSPWVLQQLFELDLRLEAYDKASLIIEQMQSRQIITKPESRRSQALIHWLKAEAAQKAGDEGLYIQSATSAHYEAPEISTIAFHLADYYGKIGKTSKAHKIIMNSYAYSPHIEFATRLLALNPDATALDHYRNLEKLIEGAPNHPESLYIMAMAAKKAKLWGQTRHYLSLLKGQQYSQRVCRLMAELEEAENPQTPQVAHEWWERAASAPADPSWVCECCHTTLTTWQAVCPSCQSFDQVSWQIPSRPLSYGVHGKQPLLSLTLS